MSIADKISWVIMALVFGGCMVYLWHSIISTSDVVEFEDPELDDIELITFHNSTK